MLLGVRTIRKGRLKYRDALDIDYNMSVKKLEKGAYVIKLSDKYVLNEIYDTREDAEEDMQALAKAVNRLERERREREKAVILLASESFRGLDMERPD